MSASNITELKILDALLGNTPISISSTVYVALFTGTPNDAGGGTEVSGAGYTRVSVTNNSTNWPAATTVNGVGTKSNGTVITFPDPTGSWGAVTSFGIYDAATGGNLCLFGNLLATFTAGVGNTPRFLAGGLVTTCD